MWGSESFSVDSFDPNSWEFGEEETVVVEHGGVLKETVWDRAKPLKQLLHERKLKQEDDLATEFILALLTSGVVL